MSETKGIEYELRYIGAPYGKGESGIISQHCTATAVVKKNASAQNLLTTAIT